MNSPSSAKYFAHMSIAINLTDFMEGQPSTPKIFDILRRRTTESISSRLNVAFRQVSFNADYVLDLRKCTDDSNSNSDIFSLHAKGQAKEFAFTVFGHIEHVLETVPPGFTPTTRVGYIGTNYHVCDLLHVTLPKTSSPEMQAAYGRQFEHLRDIAQWVARKLKANPPTIFYSDQTSTAPVLICASPPILKFSNASELAEFAKNCDTVDAPCPEGLGPIVDDSHPRFPRDAIHDVEQNLRHNYETLEIINDATIALLDGHLRFQRHAPGERLEWIFIVTAIHVIV
ncbi:hypothetical protein CVT24_002594 [Panaeolus cyanescens]|uniref:Uncharacterized protein n=1 Tax=Panaeolus cyanescens TaxID=181874 RepID=A0A409WPS4_9AGAR|nr:hypothetical protein CVT24_002594 [Panaeolus cyanescens]